MAKRSNKQKVETIKLETKSKRSEKKVTAKKPPKPKKTTTKAKTTKVDYTKGKTSAQLLKSGWRIKDMSDTELRQSVSKIASAVNKRIKMFRDKGLVSQAVMNLPDREATKFSVKGKSRTELIKQFNQMKNFMSSETSTITGYNKVKKKVMETLAKERGIKLTGTQYEDFWRTYQKIADNYNDAFNVLKKKYDILEEMNNLLVNKGMDFEQILDFMNKKLEQEYKEEQRALDSTDMLKKLEEIGIHIVQGY